MKTNDYATALEV